jgi:hypothetical protein
MNRQELKKEATALAGNRLLPLILEQRREAIFNTWRQATDRDMREQQWFALRQLDELAGAIDDAIRDHGGSRADD